MHIRCAALTRKFIVVFALFAASCQDAPPVEVGMAQPNSAAPSATMTASTPARRPSVRHYLERTEERCEVYSVDGDRVSPAERAPCPLELDIGERIRVAGKTCQREGKEGRERPIVCPGQLIARALADAGAGPAAPLPR
ncbi:MAG TPA: hypothetical protein PKA58_34875 [Polyangium sp.]|nr:hypothetical protein [Polyangium sp.]